MPRFTDARLKLKRADEHIADLGSSVNALPDSDVATVEINPHAGNKFFKPDFANRTAIDAIALIVGDAVHNLKCALDYTWLETIKKLLPSAVSKFAKFPIYPTRDELEGALRGKKIDLSSPDLFNTILNEVKPYNRGNFAVWPVHRLDIRDKHRLLIPVIQYSSISGIETENKRTGEISRQGFTLLPDQNPPLYIPMPLGVHVKNKGKISIGVMFKYGHGSEFRVVDSLSQYSRFVLKVVERLEILLETGG